MTTSIEKNEDKKDEIENIISNNIQNEISSSSLKNDKFKGLTSEDIIKKYEDVLFSREKQIKYMTKEIGKINKTIKSLKEKKEKSKYNNDTLKEALSKDESILKQELSNKEFLFMKLNNLENKYDDLQNKIDYIINRQNALAESFLRKKGKLNQNNEENKKLIDKNPPLIREKEILNQSGEEKIILREELKEEKKINNDNKDIIEFEEKINDNKKEKEIDEKTEKVDNKNKKAKENTFLSARERLNKLKEKKEKKEKVQKLNLSEILNQKNNNN